jgi:hypothetical protein
MAKWLRYPSHSTRSLTNMQHGFESCLSQSEWVRKCGRSVFSPQIHCKMYLGSLFHQWKLTAIIYCKRRKFGAQLYLATLALGLKTCFCQNALILICAKVSILAFALKYACTKFSRFTVTEKLLNMAK